MSRDTWGLSIRGSLFGGTRDILLEGLYCSPPFLETTTYGDYVIRGSREKI